ncbi:hypothetical protein [Acidimangrovimonas pyrenivorans]|uniref:Uncharacterized protein n=1 Tax=Acidimangrovimonas pyrenivorans TaxID=2030798 RepID=A0ABV7AL90_9RHOB
MAQSAKLSDVLLEMSDLSEEEKSFWLAMFTDAMKVPGPGEEAFFAQRQKCGLGVGLDGVGRLAYAKNKPTGRQPR